MVFVASHSVMRVGAGEQKMTNAEGDGEKSVAAAVEDIDDEPHAEVDVDMRQGSQKANWP